MNCCNCKPSQPPLDTLLSSQHSSSVESLQEFGVGAWDKNRTEKYRNHGFLKNKN